MSNVNGHVKRKFWMGFLSKWLVIVLLISIVQPMLVPLKHAYASTDESVLKVYSFGEGKNGQLGHSSDNDELFPKRIKGMPNIKAIAAGEDHSLILTENGNVYSFGHNNKGQLGHGNLNGQSTPTKIDGLQNVKAIAAGGRFSLILTGSGEVYSFGSGNSGQLGHGTISDLLTPAKIEIDGLSNVKAIAAGEAHSLILTESGAVYSFGFGKSGRLGHGTTSDLLTPTKIEGLPNASAIAAGGGHSLILTESGAVYSFGFGFYGQLGHGTTSSLSTPIKIEGLPKVTAIAAGWTHSLIITTTSDVYSFGNNDAGRLGHATISNLSTPTQIEGLPNVTAIAAGGGHSLILTGSGDIYSFGLGQSGQLGHGDSSDQLEPKKIEGLPNVKAISAGTSHSLVLSESYNSSINPNMAIFYINEQNQEDITVNMELNGNTLKSITNETTSLAANEDYTVDGSTVTISKEYLSTLTVGTTTLTFMFSAGADQSLAITVSGSTPILSDDANLTDLRIDGQTVTRFAPEQTAYSVSIPHDQTAVDITHTTSDEIATVQVTGDTNLEVGENTVTITVTAQNGNTMIYTIIVTRAAAPTNNSSISPNMATFDKNVSNDLIIDMNLNGNTLTDITNETSTLTVDTDYTVDGSTVTITKEYLSTLTIGTTTLSFIFSAGTDQNLAITVSDSTPTLSDDATLTDLWVDGQTVTAFAPDKTGPYSVRIPHEQTSVVITPSTSDGNATVQVAGDTNLEVGENTVTITVTAQNGNTKKYTITVIRASAPTNGGGNIDPGGGNPPDVGPPGGGDIPKPTPPPTPPIPITSTNGKITIPVGHEGEMKLGEEVTVLVPFGAMDQEVTITIEKLQDIKSLEKEGLGFVSPVYELLKSIPGNFNKPVTLTIKFNPTKVNEGQIPTIYYYDEVKQEWIEIGGKISGDRITVEVDHFTMFSVLVVDEKPVITFSDISGHWAEEFILQAARLEIIKGYADGTFRPDHYLTRAQAVSLLVRALDLQTDEVAPFNDIKGTAAETQAEIAAAYRYGLVIGQDGNFLPSKKVSRSQMALMLHRAYEQKTGTKYISSKKAPYSDLYNSSEETINAISMLYEMGIATGSNNRYMPINPITRAQAAKMLVNFFSQD